MMMSSPLTPRSSGICPCAQAPAVDHNAVRDILRLAVAAEFDGRTGFGELCMQLRQYRAGLDMAFAGEQQGFAESPVQRRLDAGDARRIEALVIGGEPCEAFEIGAVARMRHHQ
jgi:hypothetical protein